MNNLAKKTSTAPRMRAHPRSDSGFAFIPDPGSGPARTSVDLAESLAEHFVASATGAQEVDDGDEQETSGLSYSPDTDDEEEITGVGPA